MKKKKRITSRQKCIYIIVIYFYCFIKIFKSFDYHSANKKAKSSTKQCFNIRWINTMGKKREERNHIELVLKTPPKKHKIYG